MAIIGIDLGTTNSLAAVWRNGKSELIPNGLGEYLTPSVVSVDDDGSILVGAAARDRLISHPERTAAGFKRSMGTSRRYELGGRVFTAEDLSSFVLRRLREDAEAYLGEVVDEAVVSVPAYFAEAQRAATKRAGALAGLTVERLVNEPSAAAVAGHIGEGDEDKVCLVFDFGGGTLDVSLVERFDNVVSVTAVSGDNYLGGRDFDELIARGFCQDCNLNFDSLSRQRQETLIRQAETCKIALTGQEPVIMAVSDEEISASLALTHEWVIRKSSALFQRMLAPVRKVFMDAGVGADELDELVMVGGSSHMPAVRRYIARALNREPAAGARPDTAIAVGAGICSGMKARAFMPEQMPAPTAMAVSGRAPAAGSRFRALAMYRRTAGMWLEPPTITSSSSSSAPTPASINTLRTGASIRWNRALLLRMTHSWVRAREAEISSSDTAIITGSWPVRAILQVSAWRMRVSCLWRDRLSKLRLQSWQNPRAMSSSKSRPPR